MKAITLHIVNFLLLTSIALGQSERGIKLLTRDPESGDLMETYSQVWAIVIGINEYQNWPHLRYAVKDAEAVAEVLTSHYDFPRSHVTLLTDSAATVSGIKDALAQLIEKSGPGDGVIVFFAGHGQTYKTREGKEMGYLIPVDGKLEDSRLYTSALPMSEIRNLSELIPAKHVLFLVDACYSGLAAVAEYRGTISESTKGFLRKIVQAKTRQIITAGGGGEQVQERDEWSHSAFTYELLNALARRQADRNNDGIITSDELAEYLTSRVTEITGNLQIPQSKRLSSDEGKFVFVERDRVAMVSSNPRVAGSLPTPELEETRLLLDKLGTVAPERADDAGGADLKYQRQNGEEVPAIVKLERPSFTPEFFNARISGTVVVNVLVDESGHAIDTNILQCSDGRLIDPIVEAIKKSIFKPAVSQTGPVSRWIALPFRFYEY